MLLLKSKVFSGRIHFTCLVLFGFVFELLLWSPTAYGQDVVLQNAQRYLAGEGYDVGPIDGLMGSKTRNALIAFQTKQGLLPSGELDSATRASMSLQSVAHSPAPPVPIPAAYPAFRSLEIEPSNKPGPVEPNTSAEQVIDTATPPVNGSIDLLAPPATSITPPEAVKSADAAVQTPVPRKVDVPTTEKLESTPQVPTSKAAGSAADAAPTTPKPIIDPGNRVTAPSSRPAVPTARAANDTPNWSAILGAALWFAAIVWVIRALFKRLFGKSGRRPKRRTDPPSSVARAQETIVLTNEQIVSTSQRTASTQSGSTATERPPVPPPPSNDSRTSSPIPHSRIKRHDPWVPSFKSAKVAGRDIGGMVYVGTPPRTEQYREKARAFIDPSLSVSRVNTDRAGTGMPYWPSYSEIGPVSRATYLDWLSTGRSDTSYDVGYMFLYFYGLERRFFVDEPGIDERNEILDEVRRLLRIFEANHSVRTYLCRFIDVAALSLSKDDDFEPDLEPGGYELPLSLLIVLGAMIGRREPLSADWLLSWLYHHPERNLRTPATRCPDEFLALFRLKFAAAFPQGLKVDPPKRALSQQYQAASSEFSITIEPKIDGKPILDVSNLSRPIATAQHLADAAMDELDKYSRHLGRNPEGRGKMEAQALLPKDLWPLFPAEERKELEAWAANTVSTGGFLPLADLVEKLEGTRPERAGKRRTTSAADALASLGYGLAPDPRFALRSPKLDDPVLIFRLPENDTALEEVSDAYRSALLELAVGTFVAQSDGEVSQSEQEALIRAVDHASGLKASERARLAANLEWLLAVPPDIALLKKNLKDLSAAQGAAIRQVAVSMAHADSVLSADEVGGLEKLYRVLGLDPSTVYGDIHSNGTVDEPIMVRQAEATPRGEAIPPPMDPHRPVLDQDRIAAIRADTAKVSSVLGEIFASEPDDQDGESSEAEVLVAGAPSLFSGLDFKHSAFLRELLGRLEWTTHEFETLAQRHGLFAGGCLETINEWAIETFDALLLEEDRGYQLDQTIAQDLIARM